METYSPTLLHRAISPLENQIRGQQCVVSVAEVVEGTRDPVSSAGSDVGTRVIEELQQ